MGSKIVLIDVLLAHVLHLRIGVIGTLVSFPHELVSFTLSVSNRLADQLAPKDKGHLCLIERRTGCGTGALSSGVLLSVGLHERLAGPYLCPFGRGEVLKETFLRQGK